MNESRELPRLLRAAYFAMHRVYDAHFSNYGVTADQFVLLACLAELDAITRHKLARRASSDPSTIRAMLVLLWLRQERPLCDTHYCRQPAPCCWR
jgi:hypothetical protein